MKRCAIYTRKSTEEGLDQDFNSLHAQREACEAFIKSQTHEGLKLIKTQFDDGGFSGGSMDRPGLLALMEAVERREIDVIVVYKVDRLTRSLADFAKIVERLDAQGASFVSVTQQFNTTSSMGRLTLNVLLSFAQFEREVTAERIRDKIAASKKKGMWMGGPVPLGYDVQDRKLVVNHADAQTVRNIFEMYLKLGSVRLLKRACDAQSIVSKVRQAKGGRTMGGRLLSRGNLYQILSNPIYAGLISHKGETYEGQHDAIIVRELWDKVQGTLAENAVTRRYGTNIKSPSLLKGLVYDETGDLLSPTHSMKNGRRYRYYVSYRAMMDAELHPDAWRLRADHLETTVVGLLVKALEERERNGASLTEEIETSKAGSFEDKVRLIDHLIVRVDISEEAIELHLKSAEGQSETISTAIRLRRRGVERKIVIPGRSAPSSKVDPKLCELIGKAVSWVDRLSSKDAPSLSQIAKDEGLSVGDVSRSLQLAFLAPDIIEAILAGRQPVDLTAQRLKRFKDLPAEWQAQRQLLGFNTFT